MNGQIENRPTSLRHIPVILLSRGLAAEEKMRGLRLGAVDYLTEPFDRADVAARISSHLKLELVPIKLRLANNGAVAIRHDVAILGRAYERSIQPIEDEIQMSPPTGSTRLSSVEN